MEFCIGVHWEIGQVVFNEMDFIVMRVVHPRLGDVAFAMDEASLKTLEQFLIKRSVKN
jgi:hypothetical protein